MAGDGFILLGVVLQHPQNRDECPIVLSSRYHENIALLRAGFKKLLSAVNSQQLGPFSAGSLWTVSVVINLII